jgi:hypothetical protein
MFGGGNKGNCGKSHTCLTTINPGLQCSKRLKILERKKRPATQRPQQYFKNLKTLLGNALFI